LKVITQKIFRNQEELATPEFVPLAEHARPWVSPLSEEKVLTIEDRRRLNQLRQEIETLRRTIEREQEALAKEARAQRATERRRMRQPTRGGRQDFGLDELYGDPGGRTGRRAAPTPRPAVPQPTARERAEERISQTQAKLDEKLAEYSELSGEDISNLRTRERVYRGGGYGEFGPGYDMEMELMGMYGADPYGMYGGDPYGMYGGGDPYGMYPPTMPQFNSPRRNQRGGRGQENMEEGKIQVWAHDLTAQPGEVYRYRIVLHLFNPLFQRKGLPPEQHEKYYDKISIATEPSEWTGEVAIRPQPQWFLVDAKEREQTATVEMWLIYNGRPESINFTLEPGDVIGGEGEIEQIDARKARELLRRRGVRQRGRDRDEDDAEVVEANKIQLIVDAAVVDVHQPGPRGGIASPIMRYVDLATGKIKERSVREDTNSDDRQFYTSERALQVGLDAASATSKR